MWFESFFSVVPHGLIMKQEGLGIVPQSLFFHIAEWSLLSVVTSWHPPPSSPRLSQLWHSPNPGLQDLAWSSFACSLTSPLSLILEHHVPTTSAFFQFMEHVNLFTVSRILQVLFLSAWNMCLYIHMYSCTFLMADSFPSESQFQEEELQSILPLLVTGSASLGKLLLLILTCNMWVNIVTAPNSPLLKKISQVNSCTALRKLPYS